jgi:anti-sigma factor RsiW
MNCERAREGIHLRFDGELSEADAAMLADHLATCRACRGFDAEMRRLGDGFAFLREVNEAQLRQPVRHSAPRPAVRPRRHVWPLLNGLAAAACVGLMVLASAIVLHRRGARIPAVPEPRFPLVVRLTGECKKNYLAAEVETGVPNVRLVYIYPVVSRPASSTSQPTQQSSTRKTGGQT